MSLKIYILTEAGQNIGLGHYTRCLSLYEACRLKDLNPFFVINGDSTVKPLLNGKKYAIYNWLKKTPRLFCQIKGADIVIIDSYLAPQKLYVKIAGFVKLLICLDDDKRLDYPEGIVVNGAVNSESMAYPASKKISYLLGHQYALLRREFWQSPARKVRRSISSLLLTMGGEDLRNLTPKILKFLQAKYPDWLKYVVISRSFKSANIKAIKNTADDNTRLIYCPGASQMKAVMRKADVAISAAGQTLNELARMGLPTVAVMVADNQKAYIKSWQKTGFPVYAGSWNDKNIIDKINQGLKILKSQKEREKKSKIGMSLIDGQGSKRIVAEIIKKIDKHNSDFAGIKLRPASKADIKKIYDLSNESLVRKNSFNAQPISWAGHKKWFSGQLNNKNNLVLIAEKKKIFCGLVRFEKINTETIIGISVIGKFRGQGLAQILIKKGLDYLKMVNPRINTVIAYVKKNNDASRRLFIKTGFSLKGSVKVKKQPAFKFIYNYK